MVGEEMSKLIMFVPDLGCAYMWSNEHKQLMWCPLFANNIVDLDEDEWGCVDEDVVGEEEVMVDGRTLTLSELYREVEFKLGVTK
jgi:hypothetical protein